MNKLNLCFIGRADSVHTRRWVQPFVERGDQVWVINAAAGPAQRLWPGAQIIDLAAAFNIPWMRYPVWTLHAKAILRRLRPDLLHAHCIDLSGWVAAAAGYHPLVVTVWGSDILLHSERSSLARWLAHWVLAKADAVTAPALPLYERAVTFAGQDTVHLIHWGVDCEIFRPAGASETLRASLQLPAQGPILFCPRALAPIYNIDTVLSSFNRVVQTEPQATLLLIEFNAQPDYHRKIMQQIEGLGLTDRVRLLPSVDSKVDMAALYRLATLVVSLPSSDSLSLTVLESMACGTPVVVSELPAYQGWIIDGETGFQTPSQDKSAATAMLRVLEMPDSERQAMGQRCAALIRQRASLERQKVQSFELYQKLLSTRASQGKFAEDR